MITTIVARSSRAALAVLRAAQVAAPMRPITAVPSGATSARRSRQVARRAARCAAERAGAARRARCARAADAARSRRAPARDGNRAVGRGGKRAAAGHRLRPRRSRGDAHRRAARSCRGMPPPTARASRASRSRRPAPRRCASRSRCRPPHPDVVGALRRFARPARACSAPVAADAVAQAAARSAQYWSPVLEGERRDDRDRRPRAGAALDGVDAARSPRVSHLVVARRPRSRRRRAEDASRTSATSGACNIDVACVDAGQSPALVNAREGRRQADVRRTTTAAAACCTGTLLNDSIASNTPYLLHRRTTASIRRRSARTLNTYWFFDAVACDSKATPPYVQLTGGAMLLGRSQDCDWALRAPQRRAAGGHACFAAWRAEPLAGGTRSSSLHPPSAGRPQEVEPGQRRPAAT